MHTYRKWVLTLGIVAATPGLTLAGPLSLFKSGGDQPAPQMAPRTNQQIAESVANVLRAAGLTGYDIDVEYQDGTVLLGGKIGTPQQKALAEHMARQVPEVKAVKNELTIVQQQPQAAAPAAAPAEQATNTALFETSTPKAPAIQQASLDKQNNTAIAQQIAASVGSRLHGYDIEVRYSNGKATLAGAVSNMQERQMAQQLAAAVPGVESVNNRLMVTGAPQQMPPGYGSQIAQAAYQQVAVPGPGGPVVAPPPGAVVPGAPGAVVPGMVPGAAPPPEGAFAPPGTTAPMLNNPSLPPYAWPSYASYPNYAQVTYPQQYSASAWPYIGPFYPYPQVPLGWRQVQLEWDDGSWNLNFRPRTDRWWWFLSPKNW